MEALKTVWDFIQNEVLGMSWLNRLISTIFNCLYMIRLILWSCSAC